MKLDHSSAVESWPKRNSQSLLKPKVMTNFTTSSYWSLPNASLTL